MLMAKKQHAFLNKIIKLSTHILFKNKTLVIIKNRFIP